MISLPWRLLGLLVFALALFSFGYFEGEKYAHKGDAVAAQEALQNARAKMEAVSAQREIIGTARKASREQIRIVYKTLKEQTLETVNNHPEFNDCGLDADGLRIWNAANTGDTAPVSGEPYLSMHRAATPARPAGGDKIREPDGSAEQSYRGDGVVQPVPGSDGETGGMRTGVIYD